MFWEACEDAGGREGRDKAMIKILIADDHALLRQGIKNVLELEPDFQVVGEAPDGDEAIRMTKELRPQIVLLDINMPKINGIEVAKRLAQPKAPWKIIALTFHEDESYVIELMKAGANGYLLKDIEPGVLVQAIRCALESDEFICPSLAEEVRDQLKKPGMTMEAVMTSRGQKKRLTARELEVLALVSQGLSNQEIAEKLFLSEKTVKNHLTNTFRKIGVTDRTQAVLYAIKNKLVILP